MTNETGTISKRSVDSIKTPATGRTHFWDDGVKGFFVRVYPSGRKVYALKYRAGRVQRTYTIGTHGSPWTPEKAREEAKDALERIRAGEDPATEKKVARDALTVGQLIEAYLKDGPATKLSKRASTWAIDASNLNRHILPLMERRLAMSVTKAEAANAISDIAAGKTAKNEKSGKKRGRTNVKGGAGTARRTRTTAAAMYAWGLEHGRIKGTNPFASVKLATAPVRERFLSRAEAGQFLDALATLEAAKTLSKTFGDALRLLLLTGARKTEILELQWSEVDFGRKSLILPPERTKAGGKTGQRRIVLSPPAMAILSDRQAAELKRLKDAERDKKPATPSPYVFRAYRGAGAAVGVRKAFADVCKQAKLTGLRIHDLRHSFASFAIADGASLFLVGKLLGHANARTTERYAHLSGDPLQDAAALVGRRILGEPESPSGQSNNGPLTAEPKLTVVS